MIRTYRYRIYPTTRQERVLNEQIAICCEMYNSALQERRDAWQRQRKSISYYDQTAQITEIKSVREDVGAMNTKVLENVLKRVDLAFQGFFHRVGNGQRSGYPRFRSVRRYDSMTFREVGKALNGNRLRLSKIGTVRIKLHRPLKGHIKTLTVKREGGRWFALLVVDKEFVPLAFNPKAVGVDVGLYSLATLSDGTSVKNPRWLRAAQKKLRRLQRRVSRRKRGSARRCKAVLLLQRFHNHIRDQRRDFHHKESRKIVDTHGLIAVENLRINPLARTWLGKSVQDAGWADFIFKLAYKAEEAGRVFVKINPAGTSQTCTCGAVVRKTLRDRLHLCLNCGLSADRDHVSAQIILARGLRVQALTNPVAECVA